jgi:hypothetical protein
MNTPSAALHELVQRAARLNNPDFEQFIETVYNERAKHRIRPLEKAEADLLKKINAGFPAEKWERLRLLDDKLEDNGGISESEQLELTGLSDAYERYALRRLKYLGELAALRQTTLRGVMTQLGIKHERDHA